MGKTGLSTQLGIAEETVFGTRVAPTRFHEIVSEGLALQSERMESASLRTGRRVTDDWVANRKGIAGAINFEFGNQGFGLLLKHLLGAVATSTPGGGTLSRDHTFTLGDLDAKMLSVQVGRPKVSGGDAIPFDYVGCKIAEAELSNEVDGFLNLALTLDGQDEKTDQSLAAATFPSNLKPLHYIGGIVTVGGSPVDLRNFSLNINNGLKTDRYYIRQSSLKKEQIEETAPRMLTGSYLLDFDGITEYNRFANGTEAAIVAKWEGDIIEAALKFHLEVTLPRVRFDGETPGAAGPDTLDQPVQFKALDPGGATSPITVVYRTTDLTP